MFMKFMLDDIDNNIRTPANLIRLDLDLDHECGIFDHNLDRHITHRSRDADHNVHDRTNHDHSGLYKNIHAQSNRDCLARHHIRHDPRMPHALGHRTHCSTRILWGADPASALLSCVLVAQTFLLDVLHETCAEEGEVPCCLREFAISWGARPVGLWKRSTRGSS